MVKGLTCFKMRIKDLHKFLNNSVWRIVFLNHFLNFVSFLGDLIKEFLRMIHIFFDYVVYFLVFLKISQILYLTS